MNTGINIYIDGCVCIMNMTKIKQIFPAQRNVRRKLFCVRVSHITYRRTLTATMTTTMCCRFAAGTDDDYAPDSGSPAPQWLRRCAARCDGGGRAAADVG